MNWLRLFVTTRRHPSAVLLAVQLLGLLLYPLLEDRPGGYLLLSAFGLLVLVVAIRMVRSTPGLMWISIGIAVPAVALSVAYAVLGYPWLLACSAALEAAFYFYAAGSLIAYMLDDHRVSVDELFAAGATFTLLAWGFAYLYQLCQVLQPGSFAAAVDAQTARSWTQLLYLSFATLSSTGIGDVIPVRGFARALVSAEMFAGVMFLALVVTRLVALMGRRPG